MQWIKGPPDETGLWLVKTNVGDYAVWTVSLDAQEDEVTGEFSDEYLRMSDEGTSEPLEEYRFPPQASFGPICPQGQTSHTIHEANVKAPDNITKPRPDSRRPVESV